MVRDIVRLALVAACTACSGPDDAHCESSLPWATVVHIALFDQHGRPVCNRGRIEARQASAAWYPLWDFPGVHAELLPNGRFTIAGEQSCNLYYGTGTEQDIPQACTDIPLRWRVSVDGCEPAEGAWSWEQNIAYGQVDISFYVPVRLRCTRTVLPSADASTDAPDASSDVTDAPPE